MANADKIPNIEIDNVHMKQDLLMEIDTGSLDAMYCLGWYYQLIEKDYDLMKKYYFMAIDKDHSTALKNLEYYYKKNKLLVERVIDFYQHNIEITEDDITETFAKCKMGDKQSINLIRTVDLRSYEKCPELIKIVQKYYIMEVTDELNACNRFSKDLVGLIVHFFI